jgi:hypothetical protein
MRRIGPAASARRLCPTMLIDGLGLPIQTFIEFLQNFMEYSQLFVYVDTVNKLFTGVNDTSDELSPVTLLQAINY